MHYFFRHTDRDPAQGPVDKATLLQWYINGSVPPTLQVAAQPSDVWISLQALVAWDDPKLKRPRFEHQAVAALVLGLLAAPFFPFVGAIMAICCGHIALRRLRGSPWRKGQTASRIGLTLGYLCLLLWLGLLGLPGKTRYAPPSHEWGRSFYHVIPS